MYGVVDIGSNTVRMVVYHVDGGKPSAVFNKKYPAGLADYIDEAGMLTEKGIEKLIGILKDFDRAASAFPDFTLCPFATASLRNIGNTSAVLSRVKEETGLDIQVLSGYGEAVLGYEGALPEIRGAGISKGMFADIGGGSTELVYFKKGEIREANSIAIGSLNLYRKYVNTIFPDSKALRKMEKKAVSRIRENFIGEKLSRSEHLCLVGGTARALLSLYRDMTGDSDSLKYDVSFIYRLLDKICEKPEALIRSILRTAPDRVHTLIPGAVIIKSLAELYNLSTIFTASGGVRDGYIYHVLRKEAEIHE